VAHPVKFKLTILGRGELVLKMWVAMLISKENFVKRKKHLLNFLTYQLSL